MWPNSQETADLVAFTAETLNGKLHFLCSGKYRQKHSFHAKSSHKIHGPVHYTSQTHTKYESVNAQINYYQRNFRLFLNISNRWNFGMYVNFQFVINFTFGLFFISKRQRQHQMLLIWSNLKITLKTT